MLNIYNLKSIILLFLFFTFPVSATDRIGPSCPINVCDSDGTCTVVKQCLWVDSSSSHCSVINNETQLSCNNIQNRQNLNGVEQCNTLGEGTQSSPWCTIEQAAESAEGGSLVYVAPGRYLTPGGTHGLTKFATSGTKENPIFFRHYDFDETAPSMPQDRVEITPFIDAVDWSEIDNTEEYLICQANRNQESSFSGIATNVKSLNNKPLLKLFNEGCGVTNIAAAKSALQSLALQDSFRVNEQGYYAQVWTSGSYGGSSSCPVIKSGSGSEVLVRVDKSESINSCADVKLKITDVGHTMHLQSSGDVCGDLEEVLLDKGINETQISFNDNESDHIKFQGLYINAANYGVTIETDHIELAYSVIDGSYKDGIKAIGPEPWDHRQPNQCARIDENTQTNVLTDSLEDLINYCKLGSSTPLKVGSYINSPTCEGDNLIVESLHPSFFYWQGDEPEIRVHMENAKVTTEDEYCVGLDCIFESKASIQKYCREVAPSFIDSMGIKQLRPDQCIDYNYFNSQHVKLINNEILHHGEDGIDITGGDNWLVKGNTIHDSKITHGHGQLPSGFLTKNVSANNTIEENLLYNIHHSVTGIMSLGGSPTKNMGASNIISKNNIVLSSSGNKIININGCQNCLVANNLFLDLKIGENGSRSYGILHSGGNRRSCYTSSGIKVDCSSEKRSESYEGNGTSVVNNIFNGVKWRDRDSFRMLSFGGYTQSNTTDYLYNGDKNLCIKSNHVYGGYSITPTTTHVTSEEVPELACSLSGMSESITLQFENERLQHCVDQSNVLISDVNYQSLISCLIDENEQVAGIKIPLVSESIFSNIALTSPFDNVSQIGKCGNTNNICTSDSQCGSASCNVDPSYLNKCALGPNNTSSPVSSSCSLVQATTYSPLFRQTTNAYLKFSWDISSTDIQYRFLLYRFHPNGGQNNAAWTELVENNILNVDDCNIEGECIHRSSELLTDATYTWQVRRHNQYGWGVMSDTKVFTVSEPERVGHSSNEATGLLLPTLGESVSSIPDFSWQYDPFAQEYSILVYRYDGAYHLEVNLKLTSEQLSCSYEQGCNINASELLSLMGNNNNSLVLGNYTWKTKKWVNGQASAWNTVSRPFSVH